LKANHNMGVLNKVKNRAVYNIKDTIFES